MAVGAIVREGKLAGGEAARLERQREPASGIGLQGVVGEQDLDGRAPSHQIQMPARGLAVVAKISA